MTTPASITSDEGIAAPEVELLEALIRCRSITPEDDGCQDILAEHLRPLGFECESMPFGEVSNLWARRGTDGPLLCFAGHTDVVPPGHLEAWDTDPFEPVIREGVLYGRGAADMKASIAAMMTAVTRFTSRHPDHGGSIAFLITSDEEGPAADGTKRVVETLRDRGEHIDWCILGEPSSHRVLGDTVRVGRRGSLSGLLDVRGRQGHVAYPHLASNPIRSAAPVLAHLCDIRWDEGNEHFPPTSFEIVEIESGAGAPNVIPGHLKARFNLRYSTAWSHGTLKERVQSIFDRFEIDYELDWRLSGEPFLTGAGRLTESIARAIREVGGIETEFSTGGGTSDGRFISPAGADVVELGPVSASIHQVNENVAIGDLPRLSAMYERAAELLLPN